MLMGKYLVIETTASLLRIPLESLVYVKEEGNYSRIFTVLDVVKGSKGTLVTYKLGWIHNSLSDVIGDVESKTIVRAGKSHIINLDFVSEINISQQTLALSDCDRFNVVLSDGLSREVLKALKSALGNDNND